MTTITEALRAARACIQQDRTSLADTGMRHDNTMEPDAAAGVAEYDAVLQQIDAALAGMTHHITDEQIDEATKDIGLQSPFARYRIARAILALAAPAPAVPGDELAEFERAYNRLFRGRGVDTRHISDCEAVWMARAALTAAPTPPAPTLVCPQCGVDRFKEDCNGDRHTCPVKGEAQADAARAAEKGGA